ncbi:tetratricopeptide repeat protein [Chitinophaga sp. CF418]|uniref:tetratricopeptide repeat protein n=1 Tax=Chitinophaga sp. CF418 TaxID=1855287 RepID=UPI00091DD692|nr:tetratricopeptide repeat protein [Chitinophaga sp. CF418]SHL99457.1 TPR repeat-containing protein [Chitinophaga sp. CF418]
MRSIACILSLLTIISCQPNNKSADPATTQLIFKDSLGHTLYASELADATGQVNYETKMETSIDEKAVSLHQAARQAGEAGKYDEAISQLTQAIQMAPTWAYPPYDLAFTYLLKGDAENALKFYKKADELVPKGFFTTKTAIYALEGEKSGRFPEGLYTAYMQIEWAKDEAQKIEIAKLITEKVPGFAPAWKELASLLTDNSQRLAAIEQGLSKSPDAETKGILLINKAIILNDKGEKEAARQLLGNLIFSPDATTANIELAKFTLKSITTSTDTPS